ncbi:MAG: hypothetical protein HOV94_10885 [Saccharothrix sp.]|nr:hypothetical protein [Saccharothrix sp.]
MTSTGGTRPNPGHGRQGERARAGGVGVHDLIAQIELVTRLWSRADVHDQATVEPVMTAFARLSMMVHDLGRDPAAERSVPMDLPELRAATNQLVADFTAWLDDRGRRRGGAGRRGGC